MQLINNFVKNICHCEATWTTKNIIAENIENIRKQVGTEKVLLALSGGVDSSVLAALLHEAIGDQLVCVFVTGLMRKNCPGCGRAHAPHPETGTWRTRACIEAQLSKPIDTRTGTVEDGMSEPAPRKRRGARH